MAAAIAEAARGRTASRCSGCSCAPKAHRRRWRPCPATASRNRRRWHSRGSPPTGAGAPEPQSPPPSLDRFDPGIHPRDRRAGTGRGGGWATRGRGRSAARRGGHRRARRARVADTAEAPCLQRPRSATRSRSRRWDPRCSTRPSAAPCRLNLSDDAGARRRLRRFRAPLWRRDDRACWSSGWCRRASR